MFASSDLGCLAAQFTPWFDEVHSIDQFATLVTLVTPGILIVAQWTLTLHKPGQSNFIT